jgi:DNA-directed RNA polymerase beta subunit
LTYSSAVLVDMRHCVHARTPATARNKSGGIGAKLEERIYREVCICKLPIMVGSSLCHTRLRGMTDTGGYFIVNGNRKVIVMQETMVTNKPCIMPVTTGKFAYKCEVRSYNEPLEGGI